MIPLSELLKDKTFERYFRSTPKLYPTQLDRDAWRVWIKFEPNSPWRHKSVRDYQSGVDLIVRRIDKLHDAALQSRGVAYDPPSQRFRLVKNGKPVVQVGKDGMARPEIKTVAWRVDGGLIQDYGPHLWCFYCRRPTVFAHFEKHHRFRGTWMEDFVDSTAARCTLCGITDSHGRRS